MHDRAYILMRELFVFIPRVYYGAEDAVHRCKSKGFQSQRSGTNPIKILQRKFYSTKFSSILIGI